MNELRYNTFTAFGNSGQLDYLMDRYPEIIHELRPLFFPVERQSVFWEDNYGIHHVCKNHYAIVDSEEEHLFSIVSSKYKLTTNLEMVYLGLRLAELLLHINIVKPEVMSFYLSSDRARCEVVLGRSIEEYQPLFNLGWKTVITMRNSYNKSQALSYRIGFHNVLLNETIETNTEIAIKVAHSHSLSEIEYELLHKNEDVIDNIALIETSFVDKIRRIASFKVGTSYMLPLMCRILELKRKDLQDKAKADDVNDVLQKINSYLATNIQQYGTTAIAALYTCMMYVKDLRDNNILSLLHKANPSSLGLWVDSFLDEIQKPDFELDDYIGEDAGKAANWFETL